MNEKDWQRFSDLLDKIVDMGVPFKEKAAAVRANVNETNLEEFVAWFREEE